MGEKVYINCYRRYNGNEVGRWIKK